MGYDTFYNVNIISFNEEERNAVREEIARAAFDERAKSSDVDYGFEAHWYDHDDDLKAIAKRHPDVIIEVSGDGEDPNDIWASRYHGDRSETIRFDGLPDFKEILTSQEEEDAFRKAAQAYDEALDALSKAAVRRVRILKDRITEEPGRHLCLERLNDDGPELVIADSLPLSNREYAPLLVTGIQDDGEAVCTEGDPVAIGEMLPEDKKNLVGCLEGLVRDIEKGTVKGRWDDNNEWYELYRASGGDGE